MKQTPVALCIGVLAAFFSSCNAEEIKNLNDQITALTTENTSLKTKAADVEKMKTEMQNQVTALAAERDKLKTEGGECEEQKSHKGGHKTAAKSAPAAAEKSEDKKAKPAASGKPKFSAPKKAK